MQHSLFRLIISIALLLTLCACGGTISSASSSTVTATATTASTSAPTTIGSGNVVPMHGSPHLGGPISDFYGKFGQDLNGVQTNGGSTSSVSWLIDPNNADGGYTLLVHYLQSSGVVNYISYNGPSSWSKAKYRDYLIATFAPADWVIDSATNAWWASQGGDPFDPIAYTSTIGKFFLHISDGNGWMNTV